MTTTKPCELFVGVDVGSTTLKIVAVDPSSRRILWSDYQRHESCLVEKLLSQLDELHRQFPGIPAEAMRMFATGSGAKPLVQELGASFVQEVNAVTLAVEKLHPDVGSVIELGGQDAKIIIFRVCPKTGEKTPDCSMNDKCASGTGATIDKCMIKVGMTFDAAAALEFDGSRLHKVAAKCGVFAETDVVNLIKSGIPANEVMCSLANAIVSQNLSVLTRGKTLLHNVLLLGGPNTYLPFLQQCWKQRIPETWQQRGYKFPQDRPIDELIQVPENAQYYAAYGAVLYGMEEPANSGRYRGREPLAIRLAESQSRSVIRSGVSPLVASVDEAKEFARQFAIPAFQPVQYSPGDTVRATVGLDGGSTSSKAVLCSDDGEVLAKAYRLSRGNPIQDMKHLLADLQQQILQQGAVLEVRGFGVTGYAADVLEECVRADANIVETVAHMTSAVHFFGNIDVICDIGGQDIKVLFLQHGEIRDFRLSNQCSAGNGMLLQAMADQFGVPLASYAETAFRAKVTPVFSYGCAVFLDSDRVNFQREGYSKEELLAGLAAVLPKNIWQYVVQIPRLAELGRRYVLQGGTQYNLAAVKAQIDYIRTRVPNAEIQVHPHCGEAGAIGAALEAARLVRRRGASRFIGLENAISLGYTTRNDESTRCHFCSNLCSRTFVDTTTADGTTGRYISGFSCEKGTVESSEALRLLVGRRKELKRNHVNLVEYESQLVFQSRYQPSPMPDTGATIDDVRGRRGWLARIRRQPVRRDFLRSDPQAAERRAKLRIGIPRVLSLYSTAPLFRAYFETLGIPVQNVCFSPATSGDMFEKGATWGSVDPCYPSKVVQAHLNHLLFHMQWPLDYIFFPSITHLPTFVEATVSTASCPIVAGTPNVMKAAFTSEESWFERCGVEYVDGTVTLEEPTYFKRQMFEMWGTRLGITEDESDFAVDQGWESLRQCDDEMQRRGQEILERVERENSVALLMIGRPYHNDPGINHGLLEEFQALGYPVLSIRSIPKNPEWLTRFFQHDLDSGRISSPLDVRDVWPENYSTNSAQKVWAAKFAARHPHVAVLDLSSFKCGHDAPTYGLVNEILKHSGTPYMAMHDLDANKPAGSQKIRVKTYAYTLQRYQETLDDRAAKLSDLEHRVSQRRLQLLEERRRALKAIDLEDAQLESMQGPTDFDQWPDLEQGCSRGCRSGEGCSATQQFVKLRIS